MNKVRITVGFFVMGLILGVTAWGVSGGWLNGAGSVGIIVATVLCATLLTVEVCRKIDMPNEEEM